MKKISIAFAAVILLGLLLWTVFQKKTVSLPTLPKSDIAQVVTSPPPVLSGSKTNSSAAILTPPSLGETILSDYASASTTPENDLTLLSHLLENFILLVKPAADRPMSANEDWADALRGKNPAHERFLPDAHIALNAQGQLVDRWKTPLFFHALGGRRFDIRSAGPDKKMWTDDDLHRNADGTFRRGAELNPPSLIDSVPVRARH